MRYFLSLLFIITFSIVHAQQINIVPKPVSVKVGNGSFTISKKTVLAVQDEEDKKTARFFNDYLKQFYGFTLDIDKKERKNYIRLATKKFIKAPDKDAYSLDVTADGVTISGDTYNGTFYGIQSLIQLLPVQQTASLKIPFVSIQDYPRFAYRGLHLDVGRHFFPPDFVKKYIDFIALHKMNYFHWHLTEDQGWRIEIKKYPRLTEVGAYRNGTIIGHHPGIANDNIRYGGFYTQEEVKDIVQYAADRRITVIPEIEMPGHSSAAIAAYPWLSCFPDEKTKMTGPVSTASQQQGGKQVQETWGVFEDVYCAGRDSTFKFLEDVLDEVIPLFPSTYFHVGGDESPKANWHRCPYCQKRIKDEGLKDEHQLQSYFIQRMEKYLNAKGKTLIGWDEILEGGLAQNAVVMSWRGEAGGIEAARQKHSVIMTPGNYVYFDHAQSLNEDSVTIGGYTPLDVTYNYEPIPAELNEEQGKYVMGAQANLWTEYIANTRKAEYMLFPRLSALSEVLWSPKAARNWPDFEKRLPTLFDRYKLWGANYSTAYYDIKSTVQPAPGNKGVALKLETKDKTGRIVYGVAGSHYPKNYTSPIIVNQSQSITGLYYKNNQLMDTVSFDFKINKATGKKITLKEAPSKYYPGSGAFTLVDGIQNTTGMATAREFIGFSGTDLEATIDLGSAQKISGIVLHTLQQEGRQIYHPASIEVFASNDGKTFKILGTANEYVTTKGNNGTMQLNVAPATARFIKVVAKNNGTIPEGKPGAGNKSWLFADEIEIN